MILLKTYNTEENMADFAIFLTPVGGILAKGSIIALTFISLLLTDIVVPLLWRVMSNGPACDSLFSNTLK